MFDAEFLKKNIEKANRIERELYRTEVRNVIEAKHSYVIRKNKDGQEMVYMRFGNDEYCIGDKSAINWQIDKLVETEMRGFKN